MIKLISFEISPFAQRVTALLEAKGVPYEVEYIDLWNPPAWLKDISPKAQVPVLIAESGEALGEAFERVEAVIAGEPFFNGRAFGNVDSAWLPLLHRAAVIEAHTGHDFIARYPKVKAWQRAVLKTGIAERSVSEGFESAFTGFYLTDSTHLGRRRPTERGAA